MSLVGTDDDVDCYPGTTVLRNLQDLTSQRALTRFETAITAERFEEPLPDGRLSVRHFRAVRHHLFQDVLAWAGKSRTVRISKEGSAFCYPEHIDRQLKQTFGALKNRQFLRYLSADEFAEQAAEHSAALMQAPCCLPNSRKPGGRISEA